MIKRLEIPVAIRVDAGPQIGTGHLMRMLTLADALKQKGARVRFVSRCIPLHLQRTLEGKGHEFMALPAAPMSDVTGDLAHSHWLNVDQMRDAEDTRQALSDVPWEWLIVDHYALDARWEGALRACARRIFVIDDLADRTHDCDILLDQNLVETLEMRYVGKVPAGCRTLLGANYALLNPIYEELHDQVPARSGPIRRLLIFFGGADRDNLTGRSLAAFLSLKRRDIEVDAVIGSSSPHAAGVRYLASDHANVRVHDHLPTLAPLMAKADLALGATGATSWERLCLGLPSLVVTMADNQHHVATYLHKEKLVEWLGDQEAVDEHTIAFALCRLLAQDSILEWSQRCARACTGRGLQNVLDCMKAVAGPAFACTEAAKARP